jgi:acyl carrier protein
VSAEIGTIEQVKKWLLARKPQIASLELDVDLIENRIIDSLTFTEFVFFLEELTGRDLQASSETVASFRTLRTIDRNILHCGAEQT